jgi:cytochrome oxidase Cu insertion factor (SCO1/SenC/PrrC family)
LNPIDVVPNDESTLPLTGKPPSRPGNPPGGPGPRPPRPPRPHGPPRLLVLVALAASLGVAVGLIGASTRHRAVSLSDVMSLSPVPVKTAPGFTFTDQNGLAVSLEAFRGRSVVLEFMDPRCTDICPIVSQEFSVAYRDLGARADQVVFLAINVNQFHEDVGSILQFTNEQRLGRLPTWHFLTGSTAALQAAWRAYGVAVEPNQTGDVIHTSLMYFIDPAGQERYVAVPQDSTSYLDQWGGGIARYSTQLLSAK